MNESPRFWRARAALIESPLRAFTSIGVTLVVMAAAGWWSITAARILPLVLAALALTFGLLLAAEILLRRDISRGK